MTAKQHRTRAPADDRSGTLSLTSSDPSHAQSVTKLAGALRLPEFTVEGGSDYGAAFRSLRRAIEHDIASLQGDGYMVGRPCAFFLTGSMPQDKDWHEAFLSTIANGLSADARMLDHPIFIPCGFWVAPEEVLTKLVYPPVIGRWSRPKSTSLEDAIDGIIRQVMYAIVLSQFGHDTSDLACVELLHRHRWVYGDLSFKNATFAVDPLRMMLTDCDGAASLDDRDRRQYSTPFWEPPEGTSGAPGGRQALQDHLTDVYKLGLAILRCLTPGKGASTSKNPDRLADILDAEGIELVTRAVSARRTDRPTARELHAYLAWAVTHTQAPAHGGGSPHEKARSRLTDSGRTPATERTKAARPTTTSTGHVFLSYSRHDVARVDRLHQALADAGIHVWRDTTELWPGDDWKAKIRQAISRDALAFLACFSVGSLARGTSNHNEELSLAIDEIRRRQPGRPWLIPVRLDDCEIPDLDIGAGRTLASLQRADLFGENVNQETRRLVTAVLRILGTDQEDGSPGAMRAGFGAYQPGAFMQSRPDTAGHLAMPFYIICDISNSTRSDISVLTNGIRWLRQAIAAEPVVDDVAQISIIAFSDTARVIVPMRPITGSEVPEFTAGGLANYGAAFRLLADAIKQDIAKLKATGHFVYRPCAFFIARSMPSDSDWHATFRNILTRDSEATSRSAVYPIFNSYGFGQVDAQILRRLAYPPGLARWYRSEDTAIQSLLAGVLSFIMRTVVSETKTAGQVDNYSDFI